MKLLKKKMNMLMMVIKPTISGDITFDNVYFKFDDTDKHLLNGVSFQIRSGETVAVIGKQAAVSQR